MWYDVCQGFVYGSVSGSVATGQWFEAGVGETGSNFGGFKLSIMAGQGGAADYISGVWWYSTDSSTTYPWVDGRLSSARPSAAESWVGVSPSAGTVNGFWASGDPSLVSDYDLCLDGDWMTGSYNFSGTPGYETARCFPGWNGALCAGLYVEDAGAEKYYGSYLLGVSGDGSEMRDLWW